MRRLLTTGLFAALGALIATTGTGLAQNEQFFPSLVYRSGAYAPNGIPFANGVADYLHLLNARDGGIGGVKITTEECETGYATDRGVECYERLKGKGPTGASLFMPLSTGITYALMEKAPGDKIPLLTSGYGQERERRRQCHPLVVPDPRHLLGRRRHPDRIHRQGARAAGTSSRARRSPMSITTRPTARSRSRYCRRWPKSTASTSNCCR